MYKYRRDAVQRTQFAVKSTDLRLLVNPSQTTFTRDVTEMIKAVSGNVTTTMV